ncbi:tetratricopeptide repeat protein [Amycolatopsis japonica]|uniref:tetratricopeptide repeat protein n=1 Tax=Amycolatopsis japonica TaxID=208439 RepID=UPI00331B46C6
MAEHAALLAVERGWFTGGVLRVDLRGYTPGRSRVRPEQTYAWLLRELGLTVKDIPPTIDEQAGAYHQVLDALAEAGRRVLLVLDSASDADQVEDLVPRHSAHRVLVTTRDVLSLPRARRIFLDALTTSEAIDLLSQLLQFADLQDPRSSEEEMAARLVELCGRLPLAVEIVAAILIDEPLLRVAELADQLSDSETRLLGITHSIGDINAVIDFSFRRLEARVSDAAALLPLLTINPGPDFHTDAAAALADVGSAAAVPRLRALRAASLLQHTTEGRWRLHDLVALYARELLTVDVAGPATIRLFDHYANTAAAADNHLHALPEQSAPDQFTGRHDALGWFDAERANLVATVAYAHRAGYVPHVISLASCLGEYLRWRRYLQDWVSVAVLAISAAVHVTDPLIVVSVWTSLGAALYESRRFDEAITAFHHARVLCRMLGDRLREGRLWNNLGLALRELRQYNEAITAHQQARDISHEFGDRLLEGQVWNNLGLALRELRQYNEAITAHQQARDLFHEVKDRYNEGMAWDNLGLALRWVRRYDEAITAHQQGSDLFHEVGDRYNEGMALNNLGLTLCEVGKFDEAISAHEQARDIAQEMDDRLREGQAWDNLGLALRDVGRFDEAIAAHKRALDHFRELGDRYIEGKALNNLGLVLRRVERFDEAIAAHRCDVAICQAFGDRHREGQAWTNLGNALNKSGQRDEAVHAWRQAVAACADTDNSELTALVQGWLTDLEPDDAS